MPVHLLRRIPESPGCVAFQRTMGSFEPNSNDRVRGYRKAGLEGDGLKLPFMSICFPSVSLQVAQRIQWNRIACSLRCLFNTQGDLNKHHHQASSGTKNGLPAHARTLALPPANATLYTWKPCWPRELHICSRPLLQEASKPPGDSSPAPTHPALLPPGNSPSLQYLPSKQAKEKYFR